MSILTKYQANILIAQDYRSGSFEDQEGTSITKTGTAYLNNKHFVLDDTASDFTDVIDIISPCHLSMQ